MPPRILIFVALSGDRPRAAVGVACELAPAGSARPLSLQAEAGDAALRRTADRLADNLDLRPVAPQLAVLSHFTALLRERPDASVAIDAAGPAELVALLAAADLARARLDAARPPAGASSLAAQRAGQRPELPVLQASAAAGDVLRAPELTTVGLIAGPHSGAAELAAAQTALYLAGLAVHDQLLAGDPAAAAEQLTALATTARDPVARAVATADGAQLTLTLPTLPADLRAVRTGAELALSACGAVRRLKAPRSLGALIPGGVAAGDDGTLVASFVPAEPGQDSA